MRKERLVTIGIIVLILLIAGGIIYSKNVGLAVKDIPSESAAKWIGNHSIVYVQAGCSHCKDQEDLFGDNWKYITSLDCVSSQANTQICINANISGTPTWVINGIQYVGVQSIQKLENLTGYTGK